MNMLKGEELICYESCDFSNSQNVEKNMGNKKPQKQKRKQLTTNVSTKFEKINYYKKAT